MNMVLSGGPVTQYQGQKRIPTLAIFSVQHVPPLQNIDEKCTCEEKRKIPLLLQRTPSGCKSRASCQGTTFHFTDMRLRQERGGEGEVMGDCCWVRASAGPPGSPLPGGGKSMCFLSYRHEGWSAASKTDIQ